MASRHDLPLAGQLLPATVRLVREIESIYSGSGRTWETEWRVLENRLIRRLLVEALDEIQDHDESSYVTIDP